MWISSWQVTLFFRWSLVFGVCAGAFYDLFRILRIARNGSGGLWSKHGFLRFGDFALCFAADMLFWLTLAVCYSIFIYRMAGGRLRLVSLFAVACGFAAWFFTCGRLVVFLADRIIALARRIVGFIVGITLVPLGRAVRFCMKKTAALLAFVFGSFYDRAARRRELTLAAKGFNILRSKKTDGISPSAERTKK